MSGRPLLFHLASWVQQMQHLRNLELRFVGRSVAFLAALSATVLVAGCTPLSPINQGNGAACKTNNDCESNTCVAGRCSKDINCAQTGNDQLPHCKTIPCKSDA